MRFLSTPYGVISDRVAITQMAGDRALVGKPEALSINLSGFYQIDRPIGTGGR